jgi:hypothetical protein
MYSKGKQSSLEFFAQMSDGDVLKATNNPPAVTTGAFGSAAYTSAAPSTMLPASWAIINDRMMYADGTNGGKIYSSTNEKVGGFIVYIGAETIPVIPTKGEDWTLQVIDDSLTTYAEVGSLSTLAAYDCIYIKTDTPANTFNFLFSALNVDAAVFQLHYWNGDWAATSGFSDGTSLTSCGFGQPGAMTWTDTTDHRPHYMFGQPGYWYRLSLASGALSAGAQVCSVTYNSSWNSLQNVWDGIPIAAAESYVYNADDATYAFYASSSIDIGGMTSTGKYYFNSKYPVIGMYVSVGSVPNTTAATTAAIKYWNSTSFTAVAGTSDATIEDAKSHAKDGWITWNHPTDEQPTMFQSAEYFSYWYEVSFDTTIADDMTISVEVMPYLSMDDYGNCLALSTFKTRMAYGYKYLPGYVLLSASINPMTLEGSDAIIRDIGDGRANDITCIKKFYNEIIVWQAEKGKDGGCTTLVEGYDKDTIGIRLISTKYGTFSAKSAVVVEDVPFGSSLNVSGAGELSSSPKRATVAFFLSREGVLMTDGKDVHVVSQVIRNYFDPTDADCIRRGYETEHWIDYDSTYQVVKVGLVTGASATVPNTFLIYDILNGSWSSDTNAQAFSCHTETEAASGQFPIVQVGGGTNDGTIHLLNTGLTDNGTTITCRAKMEFDGRGHNLHIEEAVIRSSGDLSVIPYTENTPGTTIVITA